MALTGGSENTKTPPPRGGDVISILRLLRGGFCVEAEGGRVYAVALARRGGTVLEDVPLVGAADRAVDLGPAHEQAAVLLRLHVVLVERSPEARPSAARVVLGVGREERCVASHA